MLTSMARADSPTSLLAVRGADASAKDDRVATEEPLEIRVQGPKQEAQRIAVTMRTPGHDDELAVGFLFTEGLVRQRSQLARRPVRELEVAGGPGNIVTAALLGAFDATRLQRNFYATSSCGICGKASIDHIETEAPALAEGRGVARSVLLQLPQALASAQATFARTGGLHATGAFEASGSLLALREDVGRHNAMDKVIGRLLLDGALPLSDALLFVSGRASFELVQKAAMAGAPILAAVSAPSSLALEAAERLGMTLIGFLRGDGFNVYTHPRRVRLDE
jgi:FdhD protein